MQLQGAFLFVAALVYASEGASTHRIVGKTFHKTKLGVLVEATSLPLTLQCDGNYKQLRVGTLMINSRRISKRLQDLAEEECKNTMLDEHSENGIKVGPRCKIWFHGKLPKDRFEVIMAAFECFDKKTGAPKGPGYELKTAVQKVPGKFVHLSCEAKEAIIRIHNVNFGNGQVDPMRFPELENLTLLKTCYGQILKEVRQRRRLERKVDCLIENKKNYGGSLEIEYSCEESPYKGLL